MNKKLIVIGLLVAAGCAIELTFVTPQHGQPIKTAIDNSGSAADENIEPRLNLIRSQREISPHAGQPQKAYPADTAILDIAKREPALAAQMALRLPQPQQLEYLSLVIDQWAEIDLDSAWSWIESTPENAFFLRKIMINKLCLNEPDKVLPLIKQWSTNHSSQAGDIYDQAIFTLAETKNFYLAAQLTEQSPLPDEDRTSALRSVTNEWADQNPDEAAQWALQKEGEIHDIALVAVVDRWINNSPLHAAEFVNALPDSTQKTELMQEVFSRWLAIDQSGARAWSASIGMPQP